MRSDRLQLLLGALLVTAMATFVALRFDVTTAITHFLPSGTDRELADISSRLADSDLTRTIILTVGGPDTPTAVAATRELGEALAGHPEVLRVRSGVPEGVAEACHELYFPRRMYFVSERPEAELPGALGDDALRQAAQRLKAQLGLPTAPLAKRLAPADPLGWFTTHLDRLERLRVGSMRVEAGQFVSADGLWGVLFVATRHSAFDSEAQGPLLAALESAFDDVNARHGGRLVLEQSGVHRFAVTSERIIRADIQRISLVSAVGILLLFLLLFRKLRYVLLAWVPLVIGALTATTVGLALFGRLHGMTLAFGAALLGVCIDYPVHLFNHHTLSPDATGPRGSLERIWIGLLLGAMTTVAGFGGLAWTDFPGIRQIAVFASVGVLAAVLATRYLLPPLMPERPTPVPLQHAAADALGRLADALGRRRGLLGALMVGAAVLAAVGIPRLRWLDDLQALTRVDRSFVAEEERVRDRVARMEMSQIVVSLADDLESALRLDDEVFGRLEAARRSGLVDGFSSLHSALWSSDLQRRNLAALRASPDLAARTLGALEAEGFRPQAFAAFSEALAADPPPPLSFGELERSPLGDLVRSFVVTLADDKKAVLTFLRGVSDTDALAASLRGLDGVHFFDQRTFLADTYRTYRERTLQLVGVGLLVVLMMVWMRYRRTGPTLAAFVPAGLAGAATLGALGLLGAPVNLLNVVALLLVMSMGVDYGVFLAEAAGDRQHLVATLLSLVIACLSTVLAFGLLGMSTMPALRAIGVTTSIGIFASLLLAPAALLLASGPSASSAPSRPERDG